MKNLFDIALILSVFGFVVYTQMCWVHRNYKTYTHQKILPVPFFFSFLIFQSLRNGPRLVVNNAIFEYF